jgi:hypothetical protein
MRLLAILGLLCAAACASTTDAAAQGGPAAPARTEPSTSDLEAIAARGVELYEHDRAAWVATDAMLQALENPAARGVQGWVVEATEGGLRVVFVGRRDGEIAPAFEALAVEGAVISQQVFPSDAPPVSPALARQFEARQAAIEAALSTEEQLKCSGSLNTVVLPVGEAAAPSAFDVYLLWATTDPAVLVAGGHARYRIAAADLAVVERQPFSLSCLNMRRSAESVGVQMSNGVAPAPNETHVFMSLSNRLPVYVVTTLNGKLWAVEGGKISLVGDVGEPSR